MNIKYLIFLLLITGLFSILSTGILSYISMAVMIGPWIESTIALLVSFFFILICGRSNFFKHNKSVALITAGASIGGILATGCGFAFPTLYFLNKELFLEWLSKPIYFISIMAALAFCAGSLGLLTASLFQDKLLNEDKLPFPIGEMSYKLITSQNNSSKSYYLALSFGASFIYSALQSFFSFIPRSYQLIQNCSIRWLTVPAINIPMAELPMLISIGLISGVMIAVPLAVGILTKLAITLPIYNKYFLHLTQADFNFSFCSGLMAYSTFIGLLSFSNAFKDVKEKFKSIELSNPKNSFSFTSIFTLVSIAGLLNLFFNYFEFNLLSQVYITLLTLVSAYQLAIISGKIGLAPIGRFATFVMIPGLVLFKFNAVQVTIVSAFVEICGGVTVDALFGQKTGQLLDIDKNLVKKFQWFGLMISSLTVGYIFYLLITNLDLGSSQLLAQRCQTRALTIQFQNFDFFGVILGALFSAILKEFKINPIMVLGGILMPLDWSIVLATSGLISYFIKNNDDYVPLYSGVFAANSIWIIIHAIIKSR